MMDKAKMAEAAITKVKKAMDKGGHHKPGKPAFEPKPRIMSKKAKKKK